MSRGLPYDSDAGRDYAAAITAIMHGAAYAQSARVARDHGGPFPGYAKNREPMLRVMRKHRAALKDIDRTHVPKELFETRQGRSGTSASSSASSTATATRRPPCSRRPAPSAS